MGSGELGPGGGGWPAGEGKAVVGGRIDLLTPRPLSLSLERPTFGGAIKIDRNQEESGLEISAILFARQGLLTETLQSLEGRGPAGALEGGPGGKGPEPQRRPPERLRPTASHRSTAELHL